jgi:hypothetical protein
MASHSTYGEVSSDQLESSVTPKSTALDAFPLKHGDSTRNPLGAIQTGVRTRKDRGRMQAVTLYNARVALSEKADTPFCSLNRHPQLLLARLPGARPPRPSPRSCGRRTTVPRTFLAPATCIRPWAVISDRCRVPIMTTDFEPLNILEGVLKVVRQHCRLTAG